MDFDSSLSAAVEGIVEPAGVLLVREKDGDRGLKQLLELRVLSTRNQAVSHRGVDRRVIGVLVGSISAVERGAAFGGSARSSWPPPVPSIGG